MQLKFTIKEPEALAMSEQYYNDSASHQRQRNQSRWTLPILLLPMFGVFTFQFGLSPSAAAIFVFASLAWAIIAPTRFDARIRRYMQKQMRESSFDKTFGGYTLTIDDCHLVSDGPTGHTEYEWDAGGRVMLTDQFLFIFLAGASGFPIRVSEIGHSVAENARRILQSLVGKADNYPLQQSRGSASLEVNASRASPLMRAVRQSGDASSVYSPCADD